MRNSSLIKNLRDETAYVRQVLHEINIPAMIILVIQLTIDSGFAFGNTSVNAYRTFFTVMNTVILVLYFYTRRLNNENYLLYRMLLRVAVIAILVWIVRMFIFV